MKTNLIKINLITIGWCVLLIILINGRVHIFIVPNNVASDASERAVLNIHVKHRENKINMGKKSF